jgi:hypothetical protein
MEFTNDTALYCTSVVCTIILIVIGIAHLGD